MKKNFIRIIPSILAVLMLLTSLPAASFAAAEGDFEEISANVDVSEVSGTTSDGFDYSIIDGKVVINDYIGTSTDVVIPSEIEGFPVKEIFEFCSFPESITSFTIPSGIRYISAGSFCNTAFYKDEDNWEDGVLYIGTYLIRAKNTFIGHYSIKEGTTVIADSAFFDCTSLTSVSIPSSVISISPFAFEGTGYYNDDSNWENNMLYIDTFLVAVKNYLSGDVVIKEGTTVIAEDLYSTSPVTSVTIPESVTYIGYNSFGACRQITDVYYGGSRVQWNNFYLNSKNPLKNATVHYAKMSEGYLDSGISYYEDVIGELTIGSWEDVIEVEIPEEIGGLPVTSIGGLAFSDRHDLVSVTIPNSVNRIYSYAFEYCTSLESIVIPEGVTEIDDGTFYGCTGLKSVTIPESVTNIDIYAFENCTSLADVYFGGTEEQWNAIYVHQSNSGLTNATIHYAEIPTEPDDSQDYYIIGDVDFNDVINVRDTTAILKYVVGLVSFDDTQMLSADVNLDGYANVKDATAVLKFVAGLYTGFSIGEKVYTTPPASSTPSAPDTEPTATTPSASVAPTEPDFYTGIYGDFEYEYDNGIVSIIGYSGKEEIVTIPEEINGGAVTSIATGTFTGTSPLRIFIPASITTIADDAFTVSRAHVFYESSVTDWKSISIGAGNDAIFEGTRHYVVPAGSKIYTTSIIPPTCTAQGYTGYTCRYCDDSFATDYTERISHNYVGVTTPPSCTEKGYTTYTCTDCGDSYIDNYVDETEHVVVDGYCTYCFGKLNIVESTHNYDSNTDYTWTVSEPYATSVELLFSELTAVEERYDYIYIYDKDDNLVGKYTGTALASQKIVVEGDTAKIRLTSDESNQLYGFRAEYTFDGVDTYTVKFVNGAKWDKVCAYVWNDSEATPWPGFVMTKTGEQVNGFDVYEITFDVAYQNIIFNNNNNGSQTSDLKVQNGKVYDIKSAKWYDTIDDVPAPSKLGANVFLPGEFNGWSTSATEFYFKAEGDTICYVEMDLEANKSYMFKVITYGDTNEIEWRGLRDGVTNQVTITDSVVDIACSRIAESATITTKAAGKYIFAFDTEVYTIDITYPG